MKTKINTTSKEYRKAYTSYLGTIGDPTLRERNLANAWARKQTNQTV